MVSYGFKKDMAVAPFALAAIVGDAGRTMARNTMWLVELVVGMFIVGAVLVWICVVLYWTLAKRISGSRVIGSPCVCTVSVLTGPQVGGPDRKDSC